MDSSFTPLLNTIPDKLENIHPQLEKLTANTILIPKYTECKILPKECTYYPQNTDVTHKTDKCSYITCAAHLTGPEKKCQEVCDTLYTNLGVTQTEEHVVGFFKQCFKLKNLFGLSDALTKEQISSCITNTESNKDYCKHDKDLVTKYCTEANQLNSDVSIQNCESNLPTFVQNCLDLTDCTVFPTACPTAGNVCNTACKAQYNGANSTDSPYHFLSPTGFWDEKKQFATEDPLCCNIEGHPTSYDPTNCHPALLGPEG